MKAGHQLTNAYRLWPETDGEEREEQVATSTLARARGLSNNGTASGVSEPTRAELPPSTVPMLLKPRFVPAVSRGSGRRR